MLPGDGCSRGAPEIEEQRMDDFHTRLLAEPEFNLNPPATTEQLALVRALHAHVPSEYLEFLEKANGGAGLLGTNLLQLWSAENVVKMTNLNRDVWIHPGTEHIVFIGGDGSEEHLAYDLRTKAPRLVLLNTCCEGLDDSPWQYQSLDELGERLASEEWFDEDE